MAIQSRLNLPRGDESKRIGHLACEDAPNPACAFVGGGYISGSDPPKMIQEAILQLCSELKDDSVALADAIAPTDFILNSPIGKSDGQIYKNLYSAMIQGPNALERPTYWKEFVDKPVIGSKSKL